MIFRRALLLTIFTLASTASAQQAGYGERSLFLGWLFGNRDDDDGDDTNDRGFFGNLFCNLFRTCDDDDNGGSNPLGDLIEDILNTSDGSTPVRDAIDASKNSEQPLRDFLGELLGQQGSKQPVRDFIDEALNRTDTPFLDFIADLFNSTGGDDNKNPIADFVRNLLNGTESPIEDAFGDWIGGEIFEELNCTNTGAPVCAYNIDGDEGVWVCRSFYNPFTGKREENTACAVPEFTLKNNDKCGSCGDTYPEQCPCTCTARNDQPGVYVTVVGNDDKQCVNAKWAISAQNRYLGAIDCVPSTECPAE